MNVVNPPFPPATNHSLRCFAHRATDLNPNPDLNSKLRDAFRVRIQRSKDPLVEWPRSNQLFQNTSSASRILIT